MDDLPFIDALQKRHTHMVGWMPTKQLEGKIKAGHVLVARASGPCLSEDEAEKGEDTSWKPVQLGYCIGHDQYFKRDDVGIIYQMNVAPTAQRGFIGATLLKTMFDRAAYGCRLFCCWCAQDIAANRFWEAMGFVPLAFRAGSASKARVHIFWQKRIRAGDTTTPWWFPSQTSAGSIREDRLVLPIPPGTHWSDAKPMILPGMEEANRVSGAGCRVSGQDKKRLPGSTRTPSPRTPSPPTPSAAITSGGLRFIAPKPPAEKTTREPKPKAPRVKVKNDPRLVAAARELRDRWLEQVNATGEALLAQGKYEVSRPFDGNELPRLPHHRPSLPMLIEPSAAA